MRRGSRQEAGDCTPLGGGFFRLFPVLLCVLFFCLHLSACGGKPAPPPKSYEVPQKADNPQAVKWGYMPRGLTLQLNADPGLNAYDGFSHNVVLCVFQLSEPSVFDELSANEGGIRKLLACDRFDKSVVHYERRFVSPGSKATVTMDRSEGAQFVGVVAGYFDLQPGMVTRNWQIPLKVSQEGWLFWKSDVYDPGTLSMELLLGPNSIQRTGGD
jgi:type VI secretion system VasD/TssJ family lipoprotein